MQIIKTTTPHNYLLKLNRTTSQLEVYALSEEAHLRSKYPIRDDFDPTGYATYALEHTFDCLYGDDTTSPTPTGVFDIVGKSEKDEEYSSPYREGYDEVKFFGYLKIFEDYFIHSEMYTKDVTKETYKDMKSISSNDKHTAGCIRVSQTALDWLLDNIDVGTMVIL